MKLLLTADLHFRIHWFRWLIEQALNYDLICIAPFPNYIKLDTESGELSWHTASDTWIPEDGLYDHLVLKLAKG